MVVVDRHAYEIATLSALVGAASEPRITGDQLRARDGTRSTWDGEPVDYEWSVALLNQ